MKKTMLVLLVIMSAMAGLKGQDTIYPRPRNYLYYEDDTINQNYLYNNRLNSPWFFGKEFVADSFVTITGIAATMRLRDCLLPQDYLRGAIAYAIIIDKESGIYTRVDSVMRPYSEIPDHYYAYKLYGDHSCKGNPVYEFAPVYEYYFSTPYTLYDTFYLGFKSYHSSFGDNFIADSISPRTFWYVTYTVNSSGASPTSQCPTSHWWLVEAMTSLGGPREYVRQNQIFQNGIFGILTPPDPDSLPECPRVEGFGVQRYYRQMPVFQWDDTAIGNYQIAYGPAGDDPDMCYRVPCHEWPFLLQDNTLDTTCYYHAWIRRQCHHECWVHDTNHWSEWSDPVLFYASVLPPDTTGHGTAIFLPKSIAFELSPNPAHDQVTVTLPADLSTQCQVTLHSETGRELATFAVQEHTFGLNIAAFPTGVYYVTLKSGKQTGTQKLVKQ